MRQAFTMLGVLTMLMVVGVYLAFHNKVEAPTSDALINEESTGIQTMLSLSSPVFAPNGTIPPEYTCDGENVSLELRIEGVPVGTESFVLVMDDPDIPDSVKQARGIEKFDHWAVYNIPSETTVIPRGGGIGTDAQNSTGGVGYRGPCPPDREHRYIFRLYALTGTLNFIKAPTLDEIEAAAQGMMLEKAELIGRYNRPQNVTP
jgi:hypothetical protein